MEARRGSPVKGEPSPLTLRRRPPATALFGSARAGGDATNGKGCYPAADVREMRNRRGQTATLLPGAATAPPGFRQGGVP